MKTYHMILNSGDNAYSYCSAWWEFYFYFAGTQHALQHEAFCCLSPLLRLMCWFMSVYLYNTEVRNILCFTCTSKSFTITKIVALCLQVHRVGYVKPKHLINMY